MMTYWRIIMKTHKKILSEKLKDLNFKEKYDEEKKLIEISLEILNTRQNLGLSQSDVAKKAHITQQQLSKIENGENCNLHTFLKVCKALEMELNFILPHKKQFI